MPGYDVSIWMPFYVGDYLKETAHLSAMEQGVYINLQIQYWSTGKPIPDDNTRLSRIAGVSVKEWMEVRDTIAEFFDVANSVWRHARLEELYLEAQNNKTRNVKRARKAGYARWHKSNASSSASSSASSNANGMLEEDPD